MWPDCVVVFPPFFDEDLGALVQPMSAFGTKRTSEPPLRMSALGGKADIPDAHSNVRF